MRYQHVLHDPDGWKQEIFVHWDVLGVGFLGLFWDGKVMVEGGGVCAVWTTEYLRGEPDRWVMDEPTKQQMAPKQI